MRQHLEFLFNDANEYQDGKIEIAYTPSHTGAPSRASYFNIDEIDKATDFAFNINAVDGCNIYVGAALRNPETAPMGRSSSDDYYCATAAWVDLDDAGTPEQAKGLYKDCPPSFATVTGRTPHVRTQFWWKLDEPETEPNELRTSLSKLCGTLHGDRAVVDHARIMRLGGSIAWPKKEGRIPELTEVIIPTGATPKVSLARLNSCFPIASLLTHAGNDGEASNIVNFQDGKPRNIITGKLEIRTLLEKTREQGHWHFNMRDAVAHMVSSNWTDEKIKMGCAPYCDGGESDHDLSALITSARTKWNVPEPQDQHTIYTPINTPIANKGIPDPIAIKPFPLLYADDIQASLETNDFIEDVLCENQFSVIYGESNCGKTFFCLDIAMHVALGKQWRDKEVEQGGVIYAALEGAQGTRNRIVAFKKHNMVYNDIPLAIIPSNINFLDGEGDIASLVESIKQAKSRIGDVKLIIIDTLARAMAGSDENSGQDMGALIRNADAIREVTGAHIAFVHHSGKDALKGARGHSSLRAAVDTEIEISRSDTSSPSNIKFVKQREIEMINDMAFKLEVVTLGENKRGKEVTSCVVVPCDIPSQKDDARLTPVQQFIYDAIIDAHITYGRERQLIAGIPPIKSISFDELNNVLMERGYKEFLDKEKADGTFKTGAEQMKNHTTNARVALHKKGKISSNRGFVWMTND